MKSLNKLFKFVLIFWAVQCICQIAGGLYVGFKYGYWEVLTNNPAFYIGMIVSVPMWISLLFAGSVAYLLSGWTNVVPCLFLIQIIWNVYTIQQATEKLAIVQQLLHSS
jgi:hypothetical protein